MAKSYIHIDGGAEVDPFWQTTVPPTMKQKTLEEKLEELRKSFYKNATRLDFVSTENGHFTLGKIGMDDSNTEFRIWKSHEYIHNTDLVEELFRTYDETEACSKFNEITGGSFKIEVKPEGTGVHELTVEQPDIGESEVERIHGEKDMIQEIFDYKAKSNFAKNAQKIDFVPTNDSHVIVLGMIGKSEIDRNSKYRIWKTYNHWTNDKVEYLTEEIGRHTAIKKFQELTKNT